MAFGGIPVSGGITGHGTLIHTNLLYSPLLLDAYDNPLARPAFTLGGTAGAAGYGAAFIADKDPKTLYKTAASDAEMTLTMVLDGAVKPDVYGVAIVNHNLVAASMVTAKFEGGNGNYTDITEDLIINAATLTPVYKLLSAVASGMDRWRLRIQFSSSIAWQMGEVFLIGGAPLSFDRNYNKGFIPEREIGKVINHGLPGVPRMVAQWVRERPEFEFTDISVTQLTALQAAALNGHVIFSPSGENGKALFGLWELQRPRNISAKSIANATYSVSAVFTEAPK